jgi:hypothetical protein
MMDSIIIYMPEITQEKLGFDSSTHAGVVGLSKRSYWQGYSAFLLGKSVASGKSVFNRAAFVLGWRAAASSSMHGVK